VADNGQQFVQPAEREPYGRFLVTDPRTLTKKDRVKLAGNAVTPPVSTWICGRVLQALESA
jgi:site-specific DNA-cytosine methylase